MIETWAYIDLNPQFKKNIMEAKTLRKIVKSTTSMAYNTNTRN